MDELRQIGDWRVDPARSEVGFAATALWGLSTVRGKMDVCEGSLSVRERELSGELALDARSLDTGNGRRDRHLRSPDFFDAEHHPRIVFRTAGLTRRDEGTTVAGKLRIGDTDTPLEIPVEVDRASDGALCLSGATTISRAAAGLSWNWLGTIGDATALRARITLVRADGADDERARAA